MYQYDVIDREFLTDRSNEFRHQVTRRLAGAPFGRALMIGATGVVGDPQALPWLLGQMNDPVVARIAGEAFSGITGVDLERDGVAVRKPVRTGLQLQGRAQLLEGVTAGERLVLTRDVEAGAPAPVECGLVAFD